MAREEVYKRLREIDTSNFNSSSEVEAYMDGHIDCSEWAVSTMIEKACEWLRNNWRKHINIDADGVVCFGHWENDFRKAMKGD